MKYPTISLSEASKYVQDRRAPEGEVILPEPFMKGEGKNISHILHEALSSVFNGWDKKITKITNQQQKDAFEGEYAIQLYEALCFLLLNPEVLTDRDFWRYIAICHMYEFCEWRETRLKDPCSPAAWGADTKSIDRDCVPYRMFNRALVALSIDKSTKKEGMRYSKIASGDFWKSHVLRGDVAYAPAMTKVMLDLYESKEINTTSVRTPIKNIGRLHANVFYEIFALDDAEEAWSLEIAEENQ